MIPLSSKVDWHALGGAAVAGLFGGFIGGVGGAIVGAVIGATLCTTPPEEDETQ